MELAVLARYLDFLGFAALAGGLAMACLSSPLGGAVICAGAFGSWALAALARAEHAALAVSCAYVGALAGVVLGVVT